MGASIGMAMGFVHAGVKTPVIATIGDSTFYHAGLPALVNAVQHQTPITLIIMDNGWTSMTGMQINPGTCEQFQGAGNARLDIARIVPALGVDQFWIVDPFELDDMARVLRNALKLPGVKVLLARQECAIPARRRGVEAGDDPGDRRELQPVQALHHRHRLPGHHPERELDRHRPRPVLRLRPVRRGLQPGRDRVRAAAAGAVTE